MANKKILTDVEINGDIDVIDLTASNRIYLGDGGNGYFHTDSDGRTAFTGGHFYIKSGVTNYYNYAPNQYHGSTTGTHHRFRGNQLSGNAWGIDTSGNITGNNLSGTNTGDQDLSGYALSADYLPLSGGGNLSGGVININTNTNTNTLNISRSGSSSSQVMKIGVTDTVATFNYIEDTSSEGNGNFGQYQFKLGGNDGETSVTALTITKTGISAPNLSGTNTGDQDLSGYLLNTTDTLTGTLEVTDHINIGTYSTTNTGSLFLNGSTANRRAELKCTDGNLHMDSDTSNAMYLNYYRGTGGIKFGNGAGGSNASIAANGNFLTTGTVLGSNLSGTNTGDQVSSDFTHDDLDGFVANEHIDWTVDQGSTNIHSGNYTNTTYSTASSSTLGLVKIGYTESGKNYPVELSSGKMFVNVPWTDTNTDTDTTYTAGNGLVLSGTEFRINGGNIPGSANLNDYDESGYYTQTSNANAASGTNYPTSNAGILHVVRGSGSTTFISQTYDHYNSNAYYNRSYYNGTWSSWRNLAQDTNTTYSTASSSTLGLVKIGFTESGKNYPVELSSGKMYVNVPWTDTDTNTTYTSGDFTHDDLDGFVANEHIDWTVDQGTTNIHSGNYTNTTYSTATSSTLGLVKIGFTESGKNYPVELSSGKMYVNVPWTDTDTNTTYTSGDFTHDDLDGFVANEHIDWTVDQGSTNIHSGNYTNTNTNQLTTFQVEDGDGTEVTISHAKEWKFTEGQGINVNWTDTSTGSDGDPFDLQFALKSNGVRATELNVSGNGTSGQYLASDGDGSFSWVTPPTIPTVNNGQIDGRTSGLGLSGSMDATANQSDNTTFTVTSNATINATASTMAYRTSSADIRARLFRSNYQNQSTISGAMAFRVNNGADDYIRFCSDKAAIRTFLGVPASGDLSGYLLNTTDTFDGTLTISSGAIGVEEGQKIILDQDGDSFANIFYDTDGTGNMIYNSVDQHHFKNGDDGQYDVVKAGSFVKDGGTSSQFLKADGTVDSNTYLTSSSTQSKYLRSDQSDTTSGTLTATNFILSSDGRLKENVEEVDNKSINVDWKTFEMKSNKGQKRYGVIAQELEEVHPEFVRTDDEGMKSVAYVDLLIAKIAELEARLKKIEK